MLSFESRKTSARPYQTGLFFTVAPISSRYTTDARVFATNRPFTSAEKAQKQAEVALAANQFTQKVYEAVAEYIRTYTSSAKLTANWSSLPNMSDWLRNKLYSGAAYTAASPVFESRPPASGYVFDILGDVSIPVFAQKVCSMYAASPRPINKDLVGLQLRQQLNPHASFNVSSTLQKPSTGVWEYYSASGKELFYEFAFGGRDVVLGYSVADSIANVLIPKFAKTVIVNGGLDAKSADYWIQAIVRVRGGTSVNDFLVKLMQSEPTDAEYVAMKQIVDSLRAANAPELVGVQASSGTTSAALSRFASSGTSASAPAPAPDSAPAPAPAPATPQETSFQPSAESYAPAPAPAPAPAAVVQDVTTVQGRTVNVTFVEPVPEVQAIVPALPPAQAVPADVMLPEDEEDEYEDEEPEEKSSKKPLMAAAAVAVGAALWFLSKRS